MVKRRYVKISGVVVGYSCRFTVITEFKKIKLSFCSDIAAVAAYFKLVGCVAETHTNVTPERRSVMVFQMTEETHNASCPRSPRKNRKSCRIRYQIKVLVRVVADAVENRRIKRHSDGKCCVKFGRHDRKVFQISEKVNESETYKLHVVFIYKADNIRF